MANFEDFTKTIDSFSGNYEFLSNCSPYGFFDSYERWYPTNEHWFAAHKTEDPNKFEHIRLSEGPKLAKREGRAATLRPNWREVRDKVMYKGLKMKFDQNPTLKDKLLATGHTKLVEGNNWNDTYWGVCKGKGKNKLGNLLMKLRETYQNEIT